MSDILIFCGFVFTCLLLNLEIRFLITGISESALEAELKWWGKFPLQLYFDELIFQLKIMITLIIWI